MEAYDFYHFLKIETVLVIVMSFNYCLSIYFKTEMPCITSLNDNELPETYKIGITSSLVSHEKRTLSRRSPND